MEFVFKLVTFSVLIAVISTAESFNSDVATKIRTQLQSAHTCLETLSFPLTTILFGSNATFLQVCGQRQDGKTFFTDCESQFLNECNVRSCDSVNLMPWIQGFPRAATNYICKFGFNALIDVQNDGGRDCMANVGLDISAPILDLYRNVWYGNSLNCSNASNYMMDVSNKLRSCDKKELRNMVVKYFDEVVDLTPCKGIISSGAATNVSTNIIMFIVAILASVFIALKSQ